MRSFGQAVGTTSCSYGCVSPKPFDLGIVPLDTSVSTENMAKVYRKDAAPRAVVGTQLPSVKMQIGKQGARTGWTSGTVRGKSVTKIKGCSRLYKSWKGTYRSKGGDSGSPILHETESGLVLVGIHFASGHRFHSWTDGGAEVEVDLGAPALV